MLLEKIKAEFIGSFVFCLAVDYAFVQFSDDKLDDLTLSLACFVIYCGVLWMAKPVSNALLMPNLTLPLVITGHLQLAQGAYFFCAQLFGAVFAATFVKMTLPQALLVEIAKHSTLGFPFRVRQSEILMIVCEALGTCIVVLGYYLLVIEKKAPKYVYAPGVAALYFSVNQFLLRETGAGLNIARVFGLCLLDWNFKQFTFVFFGGLIGGLLAALTGGFLISERPKIKADKQMANAD